MASDHEEELVPDADPRPDQPQAMSPHSLTGCAAMERLGLRYNENEAAGEMLDWPIAAQPPSSATTSPAAQMVPAQYAPD